MPGEYGDIIWKRSEPGVVELENRPPEAATSPKQLDAGQEVLANRAQELEALSGRQTTQTELAMFSQGIEKLITTSDPEARKRKRQAARREHQMARKDLRTFDDYIKKGGTDVTSGVQELLDNGFLSVDNEGNVSSIVGARSEGENQRLLDAVRQWNDLQQDLLESHGTSNDPESIAARKEIIDRRRAAGMKPWSD